VVILTDKLCRFLQPQPLFIDGGTSYVTILPNRDGSYGYFKHIALITAQVRAMSSQMLVLIQVLITLQFGRPGYRSFITQGLWDVTDIVGYREDTSTM
jgi:hypothetical protein